MVCLCVVSCGVLCCGIWWCCVLWCGMDGVLWLYVVWSCGVLYGLMRCGFLLCAVMRCAVAWCCVVLYCILLFYTRGLYKVFRTFTNKIELLLSNIDNTQHAFSAETPLYMKTLNSFTHTNSMHVLTLLKLTKKTCDLDPLPSTVILEYFDIGLG